MSFSARLIKSNEGKLFLHTPEYDTVKEKIQSKWFNDDKFIHFETINEFSEDFVSDLAIICAASIMSDGVHQEEESFVAKEICKEMNISWLKFQEMQLNEIEIIKKLNYTEVHDYLVASDFGANTKNGLMLFEAALHVVLADGILTQKESQLLAEFAAVLNLPISKIISRIAMFLKFEREVLVDVDF